VPPKPDAARAGEGGRDERDYRLKIVFRTDEIVHHRSLCERRGQARRPSWRATRSPRSRDDTSNRSTARAAGLPIPRGRDDLEVDRLPAPLVTDQGAWLAPMRMQPTPSTDRHRRNDGGVTDVMTARIMVPNRREILRLFWRGARTGCRKRQSAMANRPA
jgi:hypothetical protein